jgi:hypothetical protein
VTKALTKAEKAELARAHAKQFREEVSALHQLPDQDWTDWELDWLESELRRSPQYVPSDKEQAVLARIRRSATQFTGWDGYSVPELIKSAYDYRIDCDEWDQEFIEKLHRRGATKLRLREMARLVRLCRVAGVLLARFDPEQEAA